MSGQQTTQPEPTDARPVSRGRLAAIGAGALIGCTAIIAIALWVLVRPALPTAESPAPPSPTATASSTPAQAGHDDSEGGHEHGHEETPHRHGAGDVVGEPAGQAPASFDVEVAEQWVRVLLGWAPDERDATAALARARDLAPGAHLEHLAGPVLNHAAALAAGAGQVNVVEVVEVTDPAIWPAGWVVLDAAVVTGADPGAGVPPLVLHVTCEVEVADGRVVTAVIGDGAAWIEGAS